MVKLNIQPSLRTITSILFLALPGPVMAETVYDQGKEVAVLGTKMGAHVTTTKTGAQQAATALSLRSLGTTLQALFALTSPPNTIDGVTYTEVYTFGKRIFTDSRYFNIDGGEITAGLAPTQVRVPIVMYPVGPITLRIDGGVRFQANITARNATNISFPLKYTEPGLQLSAHASGSGFVEGYASFFVIRGGVGGQLDLLDARLNVTSRYSLETQETSITVAAIVEFLKGRIYAFLDIGFAFFGGMKRLIDYDLYNWNGYCFSTANMRCPTK